MTGTLYGVGVGPGDPDLLTLKAARLLGRVPVVAVPVTQTDQSSFALNIAAGHLRADTHILRLHFPMVRDEAIREQHRRAAAETIRAELDAGRDVAFLTEGDPMLHSTFAYVLRHLPPETPVKIMPGVTSITAAAAETGAPLVYGDQRLAVLPATFEQVDDLRALLAAFDTVVLMKVGRVLDDVIALLDELGLTANAVLVERATCDGGRVVRDLHTLRGEHVHYLSLLIVHGGPYAP